MPSTQLENLARVGRLKAEPADRAEIDGLIRSGTVRLDDARHASLSDESRFDLACNGVHALALAALRWHGFRSDNRYTVLLCLEHTLGLPPHQWRVLDHAHRKRNLAEYEGETRIDHALVESLVRVGNEVRSRVTALVENRR